MQNTLFNTQRMSIMAALALVAMLLFMGTQFVGAQRASASDTVTVTIQKYIDGVQATTLNAADSSFPMSATWNAENIGAGTGEYTLNTANSYGTATTDMTTGADYATNEILEGEVVGATCEEGKPFALRGYTTGDTLTEAQGGTPTLTPPSFTDLQNNKYVIVWNHDCAAVDTVTVTIQKYIDGSWANAESASGATFPFIADYSANVGTGSDPYTIGPTGNNSENPYEAVTLDFAPGANYATHEVTDEPTVGESCESEKPFALVGYTWGNTLEEAQAGVPSETAPDFTNLQNNKYVIAWNETCEAPPSPTNVKVTITKYVNGMVASSTASSSPSFPMSATWNAENIGAGTGEYTLSPTGHNSPNEYQAVTTDMTPGADYTTQELFNGSTVGASCSESEKPFALVGYTWGDTMEAAVAASSTATTTAPNFTNLQNDKYVVVWNKTCSNSGTIGGDVVGENGVLEVTSIEAVDTTATADGTYENGWTYVFHITIPTNESNLAMKFSDWTSASSTFATANNMRISSAQADNGGATITVVAADTYTTPNLHMVTDLDALAAGIQVQVTVEVRIPIGTPNASYTTSYGVKSE